MAKGVRSKIKKYWRTQLRNTIGKDHLVKQEALIQQKLKASMESQSGSSLLKLKDLFGVQGKPLISEDQAVTVIEDNDDEAATVPKVMPAKANARKQKNYDFKRHLYVQKRKGSKRHKQ